MKKVLKSIFYPCFSMAGIYTLIYILLSFFFDLPDWRAGFKLVMGFSLLLSLLFMRRFYVLDFLEEKMKQKSLKLSRFFSRFLYLICWSGILALVIFLSSLNQEEFTSSRLLSSFSLGFGGIVGGCISGGVKDTEQP